MVAQGVASPMWKKLTGTCRLMMYDTGILMQNALNIPWNITNFVLPQPLKYPLKQNIKLVSRQSIPYAFR